MQQLDEDVQYLCGTKSCRLPKVFPLKHNDALHQHSHFPQILLSLECKARSMPLLTTLCSAHSAQHTPLSTQWSAHSAQHTLLSTLCSAHSAQHTLLSTLAQHTLLGTAKR